MNNIDQIKGLTLVIGKSDKKRDIYIPEESRYLNTMIIGTKSSGKTSVMLPLIAKQDMENHDCGATYIVTKKEMAYTLYAMAKYYKRKVRILKPSVNAEISNKFLWKKEYNYDYINKNIINYKQSIKDKEIIIIDMETLKYRNEAIKATAMLLLQFQIDIQETDITLRTSHFLYIDDAYLYLQYIESILTYGDSFNIGTTLFLQSRTQLKQKDKNFSSMIDNNVRSVILLNSLNIMDLDYYKKQFYEYNENIFVNRGYGNVIYETVDANGKRRSGLCDLEVMDSEFKNSIEDKAKRYRRKLLKTLRNEEDEVISPKIEPKVKASEKSKPANKFKEKEKEKKIEIMSALFNKIPSQEFISNTDFDEEY